MKDHIWMFRLPPAMAELQSNTIWNAPGSPTLYRDLTSPKLGFGCRSREGKLFLKQKQLLRISCMATSKAGEIAHTGSSLGVANSPCASEIFVRESQPQDYWQIADTHCSSFVPNQDILMDFLFRLDRMLVLLASFPLPSGRQRKCLVAVHEQVTRASYASRSIWDQFNFRVIFGMDEQQDTGAILGILTVDTLGEYLPRRKFMGKRRSGIAYISNVAVRKKMRRKGIARKLLQEATLLAKSWACRSIALHCEATNSGAIALYISEGYKIVKAPAAATWPQPAQGDIKFVFMLKSLISL